MKTVLKILFLAFCIHLLSACDKSDLITDDLSGIDLKKASKHCPEIVVAPEAGHDTENLLAAFEDAKSLGPGTTIRLTKGTYTIGMIEVHDFDGVLTGAGQGKTIITNMPDLPCDEVWSSNQLPALITFVGGNITMSEMTIQFQDGQPCIPGPVNEGYFGDFGCMLILADYSTYYVPTNRSIKGNIDHVDFIAGNDGGYGYYHTQGNVAIGLYGGTAKWWPEGFTPLSVGEISVTNCTFKDFLVGPDFWAFNENSTLKVGNNVMNSGLQQLFFGGMVGTTISIKNNLFTEGGMFDMWIDGSDQGAFPDLIPTVETNYTITGNKFETPPDVISIYMTDNFRLKDPTEVVPHSFNVKGNVFNNGEGGTAILALNTKNAKIWDNQFLGTGSVGVMMDGDEPTGTFSEGNQLTGNNFLGATYSDATVYLGPFTRNNKVVGVSRDKVVDEGTNNKIIGTKASKHGVPPQRPLFKNFKPHR